MQLFPHVLVRHGGQPFSLLGGVTEQSHLMDSVTGFLAEHAALKVQRDDLCNRLHHAIGMREDIKSKNVLVNIRRDVYNARKMKPQVLRQSTSYLSVEDGNALIAYAERMNALEVDLVHIQGEYEKTVIHLRKELQHHSKNPLLQKGLVLSSRALLEGLNHFQTSFPDSSTKKSQRIELGLLKYLSRMCAKTSPFSTFTHLALGKTTVASDCFQHCDQGAEGRTWKITTRLNNQLYKQIQGRVQRMGARNPCWNVGLNPTISIQDGVFFYLKIRNREEVFQRLKVSDILLWIHEICENAGGEGVSLSNLVLAIQDRVDAGDNILHDYLHRLLTIGFLEPVVAVSGLAPDWCKGWAMQLFSLEDGSGFFKEMAKILINMNDITAQYALASPQKAVCLLDAAWSEWSCLKEHLSKPILSGAVVSGKNENFEESEASLLSEVDYDELPGPHHLIYEDVINQTPFFINQFQLQNLAQKIDSLLTELEVLKKFQVGCTMKDFFLETFGAGAHISLLQFYERYYRDRVKNFERPDFMSSANLKQSRAWESIFSARLREKAETQNVVNLDLAFFRSINTCLGLSPNTQPGSWGSFVQLYEERSEVGCSQVKAVVNAVVPGYGKMLSRHLYHFDEHIWKMSCDWNRKTLRPNELGAENTDTSCHCANVHPPLMPYEIKAPGSHQSQPEDKQISVAKIEVYYDGSEQDLALRHCESKERILVFDLGFETEAVRTELFKMMNYFSNNLSFGWHMLKEKLQNAFYDSQRLNGITCCPRIVYEHDIVLQRRQWRIPNHLIPLKQSDESEVDYFIRLHQWRREHHLPDRFFVIVNPQFRTMKSKDSASQDDYKPQFIDLNNPLFVKLFYRICRRALSRVFLEEMLPGPNQMMDVYGKKTVTEFLIQGYRFS